jgi:hypothetical protein
MAGEGGGGGGKIPQAILNGVTQANGFLGAGLTIIATYKAAREAWKAAHPTTDPTAAGWKSDDDLIALAGQAADALVEHADAIIRKHSGGA